MNIEEAIELAGDLVAAFESMLEGPLDPEQAMKLRVIHGKAHELHKFFAERKKAPWGPGPDALRALMLENNVSAKVLAQETGIHETTIGNFLVRRRGISMDNRYTLAERFGVEPSTFL
jgi:antitoxin component HigA of HigAB toxin-antitoxin module